MKKVDRNVITVEQLIEGVKSVQEGQRLVQQSLEEFLQVLHKLDAQAEIAVVRGPIDPGRVGKVCSAVSGPSSKKKAG
jgi:hypothetical protein